MLCLAQTRLRESVSMTTTKTFLGLFGLVFLSAALSRPVSAQPSDATAAAGIRAGFADDSSCATCHAEVYQSYQQVGMARSFVEATDSNAIEDFSRAKGFHEASKRHFEMKLEGGRYKFKRYQLDEDEKEINVFEQEVDWLLGSGSKSRSYLFQADSGELFQLPIVYYTQEKIWYMAPGYDRPNHQGVTREVRRECMFCHNAYPDAPAGSDAYGRPHLYPSNLPQGIGCQRCHGPGAEHIRIAATSPSEQDRIRGAIVNPAKLEPKLRDAVCDQCHLQPSVTLLGVRKFGRTDYSFRPGEPLADYLAVMDVTEEADASHDRFEINHHSYRLRQSQCFEKSAGDLSCTTCHDPHQKAAPEDRIQHYRSACLGCHVPATFEPSHAAAEPPVTSQDCSSCHMPKRRTQDVVHVLATDHLIRRTPGGTELTAPRAEIDHKPTSVEFLHPHDAPEGPLAEIYRATAVARLTSGSYAPAVDSLNQLLAAAKPAALEPYLDLARGEIRQQQTAGAREVLQLILDRDPNNLRAKQWQGLTSIMAGQLEEAIEQILQALREDPNSPESHYNLGLALLGRDEDDRARKHFAEAVRLRPNMLLGWYYLGRANANLDRLDEATESFRRALAVEPSHTRSYLEIGKALVAQGDRAEAERYYRHGLKVARQLSPIAKALDELESSPK